MAERTIVSCDWCGREVAEGELVRTRVRTGKRGRPRELELCSTCASAAEENAQVLPPAASARPRRVVSKGRDGGAEAYEHKEEGDGVPLLEEPPERGDLAREVPCVSRRKPALARDRVPYRRADAARERALPVGRGR